jgi:hypothetical protein
MLRWLLPREEDFFGLFERHAALTVEGAKEMRRLVEGQGDKHALTARQADRARHRRHHPHLRRAPTQNLHHPARP